jgi:hypothetical protein
MTLEARAPAKKMFPLVVPEIWQQAAYGQPFGAVEEEEHLQKVRELNLARVLDSFTKTGAWQVENTIVHKNIDTGLHTIVFIADTNIARQHEMYEDLAADLGNQYGFRLILYDFSQTNELLVAVLEQQRP